MSTGAVDVAAPPSGATIDAPAKGTDRPPGKGDLWMALIFILPALIGFLVFYLYPTIRGFYFSLTQYNLLGRRRSSGSTTTSGSSGTRCSGTRSG